MKRERKFIIFSGTRIYKGRNLPGVIATKSQEEAIKAIGISYTHFKAYWKKTDDIHLKGIALSYPGVLLMAITGNPRDIIDYQPVKRDIL